LRPQPPDGHRDRVAERVGVRVPHVFEQLLGADRSASASARHSSTPNSLRVRSAGRSRGWHGAARDRPPGRPRCTTAGKPGPRPPEGADARESARGRRTACPMVVIGAQLQPVARSSTSVAAVSIRMRLGEPSRTSRRQTRSPCTDGRSRSSTTTVRSRCWSYSPGLPRHRRPRRRRNPRSADPRRSGWPARLILHDQDSHVHIVRTPMMTPA